ncbi:hypothetical protein AXG93_1040s1490 [Marchantia polymorpha subsp. ruderalis]|uniref:Uncharacterized protein n=1 Tax=Marchantia polymorpha subsp. ruderalis TaxID=1480154 RepID=A0A176VHT6_MARPO|nr:hypothetical protein AXG93_1040s1490 [Marchantia polymorpha subsp. ruderalis]
MVLLTKNEDKRFSKKRKILELESDGGTEEEDDTQGKEITREAAQEPVRVEERQEQLQAKKMETKVLWLNLAKKKELRTKEELRIKDLRREIVAMKTERMELRVRIGVRTEAHNKELQLANELMASLAEQMKKHEVELASWATKLMAKSSEIECRVKLDAIGCESS